MPFTARFASIETLTGLTAGQLIAAARDRGFACPTVSLDEIAAWLEDDYDLGPEHAEAIAYALREDAA